MTGHEFFFEIELSGQPASTDLLRDLVSHVLDHVGGAAMPALVDALEAAVARAAAAGAADCCLQFVAHDGRLDVSVSSGGGPPWRTSRPIA